MAETVYKAKKPFKQDGKYYYPITSHDQIIMPDGNRWDGQHLSSDIRDEATEVGSIKVNADLLGGKLPEYYKNATTLGGVAAEDYALKTDTAPDSAKLGGKAPEYYVQPRNLLDNSDFLHPVNQRNKTSVSNNGYFIDRWLIYSQNEANRVTSIDSNGLTTAGGSAVRQLVQAELVPKDAGEYTFAVCRSDGHIDFPGIWKDSNGNLVCPISSAGTYIWAVLYEGSYTAETLPPYVPKGYAAEFSECRRYFRRYTANNASLILSGLVTSGTKEISVNAPELAPMRTKNVSIAYSGSGVIIRGVSGYATECSNSSIYGNISIASYSNNSSFCETIDITKKDGTAWGLTNNTPVAVSFAANGTLDYIADL